MSALPPLRPIDAGGRHEYELQSLSGPASPADSFRLDDYLLGRPATPRPSAAPYPPPLLSPADEPGNAARRNKVIGAVAIGAALISAGGVLSFIGVAFYEQIVAFARRLTADHR